MLITGSIVLFVILILIWQLCPRLAKMFFGVKKKPSEIITYFGIICSAIFVLGNFYEAKKSNQISEDGQFNSRFNDAAALLGDNNTSTAISGVFTLHKMAQEANLSDKKEYIPIIRDILCSYIRGAAEDKIISANETIRICNKPTIVIQTIVDLLLNNKEKVYEGLRFDLRDCAFENIVFSDALLYDVDFSNSTFKNVEFRNLSLDRVYFRNTKFYSCYISPKTIQGAFFYKSIFENVVFNPTEKINATQFFSSEFRNTLFRGNYNSTHFASSTLLDSQFENAILETVIFDKSVLMNIKFTQGLKYYNYKDEVYSSPDSTIGIIKLVHSSFQKAILENVRFKGVYFENSTFNDAKLSNVAFDDSKILRCNFDRTLLENLSDSVILKDAIKLTVKKDY